MPVLDSASKTITSADRTLFTNSVPVTINDVAHVYVSLSGVIYCCIVEPQLFELIFQWSRSR